MSQQTQAGWDLPHILEAEPLREDDQALIADLTAVLRKHNALGRLGVSLLHQHFPIEKDEVLCETVDPETRTLTIRPMKASVVKKESHTPTQWDLRSGAATVKCICKDYPGSGGHQHYSSPS